MTGERPLLRFQVLGLVFLAVLAGLGWLTVEIYDKAFTSFVPVTLQADRAGTQLKANADVKLRGVLVGEVREVTVRPGGVDVHLALDPAMTDRIPRNVTARLLPKTLFGQRYVSLVLPAGPAGRISSGAVIGEDRSAGAVELEQALRDLLPVLQAVQPQKLASTLGAVSQALEGRGGELGTTLGTLQDYLARLNPEVPRIQSAISKFADTVRTYETAAPDLVDALGDLRSTATTITRQQQDLSALFTTVTGASADAHGFLDASGGTIVALSADSRPVLDLLAEYAPELPCLADAAAKLVPTVDKALGAGTNQPGLHVELHVKPAPAHRTAPTVAKGPKCYSAGSATPPAVNSPAEQQLFSELLAPVYGVSPGDIPGWSGLLLGPVLRGTEVTLK